MGTVEGALEEEDAVDNLIITEVEVEDVLVAIIDQEAEIQWYLFMPTSHKTNFYYTLHYEPGRSGY